MPINNKLSISIPTYKRPKNLLKTIKSVINVVKVYNIQINILDDSCSNINEGVYLELKLLYKHLNIIKNTKNLGIDYNIKKCVDVSETKYVWLLGEDDLMINTSIEQLINILDENYDFIFVNYRYASNDFKTLLSDKIMNINSNNEIAGNDFILKHAWKIGFIGSCVINKNKWTRHSNNNTLGTYFNHVGTIIKSIENTTVYLISDEYILNRAEDTTTFTWSNETFAVFFGFNNMLRAIEPDISLPVEAIMKNSRKLFRTDSLLWIMSKRADNLFNKKIIDTYYNNTKGLRKILLYIILVLPRIFFQILKYIHKSMQKLIVYQKTPSSWLN